MSRDFFSSRNREARLTHDCCGWSSDGFPDLRYVWQSVAYNETVYEVAGQMVLDAKGTSSAGRIWHFLGTAGEYAGYDGYYGLEANDAALLDKVLDSVCVRNLTPQPKR